MEWRRNIIACAIFFLVCVIGQKKQLNLQRHTFPRYSFSKQSGKTYYHYLKPRKGVFELFDKLILLGIGGKTVYHGDVKAAEEYFYSLGYTLPSGENVADWLIDVASGTSDGEKLFNTIKQSNSNVSLSDMGNRDSSAELCDLDKNSSIHYPRFSIMERRNSSIGCESAQSRSCNRTMNLGSTSKRITSTDDVAKLERRALNICWVKHLRNLDDQREYLPPPKYELPERISNQPFLQQLQTHIIRNAIVSTRNLSSRLLDTSILVLASALVCSINGTLEVTNTDASTADFNILMIADDYNPLLTQFPELFSYAMKSYSDLEL